MPFRRAAAQQPHRNHPDGAENVAPGQPLDDAPFDDTRFDDTRFDDNGFDDPAAWSGEFEASSGASGRIARVLAALLVVGSAGWFGLQLLHGSSKASGDRSAVPATGVASTASALPVASSSPVVTPVVTRAAVTSVPVTSPASSTSGIAAPTVADSTSVEAANHDERVDGGPLVAVVPASSAIEPATAPTVNVPLPRPTPAVAVSATPTSARARAVTVPPPTAVAPTSSAAQEPSAPPTPAPTTPAPTSAPPSSAPPTAAPPTAAPPTTAPPTAAPPTTAPPTTAPPTTTKPTSPATTAPPTTKPPTSFVHVVAAGEGPAQVAAWFDQIGKSSLYRQTKALHRPLPTGTVITVVGDTVRIS